MVDLEWAEIGEAEEEKWISRLTIRRRRLFTWLRGKR
jgi:hypothetical protein